MRLLRMVLVTLGFLLPTSILSIPSTAECLSCVWKGVCYSHGICGPDCLCVKADSIDVSGFCASL